MIIQPHSSQSSRSENGTPIDPAAHLHYPITRKYPGHILGSWLRRRFRSWKVKTTLEPKQERYAEYDEMQTIVQDSDPIYLLWDQNQAKIRASS